MRELRGMVDISYHVNIKQENNKPEREKGKGRVFSISNLIPLS